MTVAEVVVLEMRRLLSENLLLSGLYERCRATVTLYSRMGPLGRAGGRHVNWRLLGLAGPERASTALGGPGTAT